MASIHEFHNRGNAAIVGRQAAVFDFGWAHLKGVLAWLLWGFVHIYLLTGFQHRTLVALQWLWRYFAYDHGALNPKAQYRFPMTTDEVLGDRHVSGPLTRAMCAPIGDGSAAALVCSKFPAAITRRNT